jgi:hypothetical protein
MNNGIISLFCLKELEQTKDGLTTDEMIARTGNAGFEPLIARTVQRELNLYKKLGIEIATSRKRHRLNPTEKNLRGFMKFMQRISEDENYAHIFYGDIDIKRATDYFDKLPSYVKLFYDLVDAILNHKTIEFAYTPQSDITRMRMFQRSAHQPTNPKVIPVRMLPRFIVTAGSSFLVLGEYYEKKGFYRGLFKAPVRRHYELRGIADLKVDKNETQPALEINPSEVYRNAVHVWAGGQEYEVELEEFWYEGGKPQRKKRIVNGEDEILSLAAGSLGRVRIVNPPEPLVKRAEAIGLPKELVFRIE